MKQNAKQDEITRKAVSVQRARRLHALQLSERDGELREIQQYYLNDEKDLHALLRAIMKEEGH